MKGAVATETLYTYDAAVNRYERERHHEWLCRQEQLKKIRQEQKERREYFCRQKFYGLLLIFVTVTLSVLMMDGTCLVLALPGIGMITSKKMLLMNEYYFRHNGTKQWEDLK